MGRPSSTPPPLLSVASPSIQLQMRTPTHWVAALQNYIIIGTRRLVHPSPPTAPPGLLSCRVFLDCRHHWQRHDGCKGHYRYDNGSIYFYFKVPSLCSCRRLKLQRNSVAALFRRPDEGGKKSERNFDSSCTALMGSRRSTRSSFRRRVKVSVCWTLDSYEEHD